ncbi:MAG: DUF4091 domain-containing protein [Clostridia bacterium]|nr:DUF4091 domain-containing protein [Clostridia bacterium]
MSNLITFITDSQTKIFHDSEIMPSIDRASVLANEPYSFTYAYKAACGDCYPISVSVHCEGLSFSVYRVDSVPIIHPYQKRPDDGLASEPKDVEWLIEAGTEERGVDLYPDVLLPRSALPKITRIDTDPSCPYCEENEPHRLDANDTSFSSLVITVNEERNALPAGDYEIKVSAVSLLTGETIAEDSFTLTVIGALLPKIDFKYTNWFHYDCLADLHNVKLFGEEYFELLKSYFKNAADYGMNLLLIPSFTPPLDTPIGKYRKKAQLVGITKSDKGYVFDFSGLERLMKLALECGIEYFEHPHLFTQWGAKHAPAIYATVNGEEKRIFGWDTDASSDEYREFLECYITAFRSFTEKLGVSDNVFYHISDEPDLSNIDSYRIAKETAAPLLAGVESGDALSRIEFYENGMVDTPIVCIDGIDDFYGKCKNLWAYYTGGYYEGQSTEKCSNRLITTKPYRTRIFGLQAFKYKLTGFLHWGFNYYYYRMSRGYFNPLLNPCGYQQRPGASFIVYPGADGVLGSLREVYMREAICDLRALKLLESLTSYEYVISLAETHFGEEITCFTIPSSAEQMMSFREIINREIAKRI